MHQPDICIAGAGIIGLSLALELHRRGLRVTVFDRGTPLAEASTAAAGMLAANDPDNPPQLQPLSTLSISLYPAFLEQIHSLSGIRVPFHTQTTLQSLPPHVITSNNILTSQELTHHLPSLTPGDHRFILLDEHSLDPRELAAALLVAVRSTTIDLHPNTSVLSIHSHPTSVEVHTSTGILHASHFIDCTGAWAATTSPLYVVPKKGQMLSVDLPPTSLNLVIRTPEIYIVPRTTNPQAIRAIIGATVEDAGFDKKVYPSAITHLRNLAAALLPSIANAPQLEAWAGLRPATSDNLPLLGPLPAHPRHLLATGHYRNGILLAPATAHLMAQYITGEPLSDDLAPFSPARFAPAFQ